MAKYKVVVTDQVFPDVELERSLLADFGAELEVASGTMEEVVPKIRDADALLNTYLSFDQAAIQQLEKCKIIARYGIGVDNIDIASASKAGIVVTNVPDYCVEEVATHTIALLLNLIRRISDGDAVMRSGKWSLDTLRPMTRLSEMTIGMVGYGRIARLVAAALSGLGASLLVFDPYVTSDPDSDARFVELDELLRGSDAISLHAPLTDETRGMISARELKLLPNHAVVVNTSRGPLINLDDIIGALERGEIRAAGLDVFEQEPPDMEALAKVPNLLMTPHMAYYSESSIKESQRKATTQIIKVLSGETPDYAIGGS